MRSLSVLLAPLALAAVLATPASSGNGIDMRFSPGACSPACIGDRQPAWSPDGKTIAFVRRTRQESPRTIFTVASRGGPVRRLFRSNGQILPDSLVWSPDSSRLAFRSLGGRIYVLPAAGGEARLLSPPTTPGPGVISDRSPVWSRDGTRIAFVRYAYAGRFEPPSAGWCCQLWTAAADGSGSMLFGGGRAPGEWLAEPAWAPDGRIAYVTGPRTSGGEADLSRGEIWISNADGSARRLLVGDESDLGIHHLSWSRDGSRLSYVAEQERFWTLGWVAADGNARAGVALVQKPSSFSLLQCCEFAPDGLRAVYASPGEDGGTEVFLVEQGKVDRQLADGVGTQMFRPWLTTASWSPDGERIAYVSDGECATVLAVHTIRVSGADGRRLTLRCRITGTSRRDLMRGNREPNALYGRGGNDRLDAGGRPDFLQGGFGRDVLLGRAGDDRLYGGPGADRISGGADWDAIYSRDGVADVIHCGSGDDTVRADHHDRVARDCELVERE